MTTLTQWADSYTKIMPCFREVHKTSVGSCTYSLVPRPSPRPASCRLQYGPARTTSDGKLPGNEANISTSRVKAAILHGKPRGGWERLLTICTANLTGDRATVISDRLVASWTSRSNSESESEITIVAIMCSAARQRKELEGRWSEPPSSTVYIRLQHCISAYTCRRDQVTTSGPLWVLTRAYLNTVIQTRLAKPHPLPPATFVDRKLVVAVQMGNGKGFSAHS